MKRFILTAMALLLATGSALAQAEIIKQKAKNLRDQNNLEQGVAPPAAPTPLAPGTTPPPAAAPALPVGMNLAPQPLLDHFDADLAVVKTGAAATPEQKLTLLNDLTSFTKGVTKPSKPALTKLADDLSAAYTEKALSASDAARMAKFLNVILNSSLLTATRTQPYVDAVQKTFKAAGVTPATADAVSADLKAIVLEIQQNKPKLYQ